MALIFEEFWCFQIVKVHPKKYVHTLSYFCGLLIVDFTYISHNYFKATGSIAFPLKQNLIIDQKGKA